MCGTTHKTVKRIIDRDGVRAELASEPANYELVGALVRTKVDKTSCKITVKRLLPAAVAAGYQGSDRDFRRLVAQEKEALRTWLKASTTWIPTSGGWYEPTGGRSCPASREWPAPRPSAGLGA